MLDFLRRLFLVREQVVTPGAKNVPMLNQENWCEECRKYLPTDKGYKIHMTRKHGGK